MPAKPEVAEWVEKAEEDYDGALVLMRQRTRPFRTLFAFTLNNARRNISKRLW